MTTHGLSKSPTYKTWLKMKERCTNPKAWQWKWYGGRGIAVCERWLSSFESFFADMGERPSKEHSIDRYPDADGNYEPGNCRWASRIEQIDNQKKTIWVTVDSQQITLRNACKRAGINFHTAYQRLKAGYQIEVILATKDRRFSKGEPADLQSYRRAS